MSPKRRQKVTDDEVFAADQRAMTKRGPHELTLARYRRRSWRFAGAARAAIRQQARLASRLGRPLRAERGGRFRQPAGSPSPSAGGSPRLCGVHGRPRATPEALSRNLAYLQIDLTDPDFRSAPPGQRARHPSRDRVASPSRSRGGGLRRNVDHPGPRQSRRGGNQRIADVVGLLSRRLGGCVDTARPQRGVASLRGATPPTEGLKVAQIGETHNARASCLPCVTPI